MTEVLAINKSIDKFRDYEHTDRREIVYNHYRDMRRYQTVEFVKSMHLKYSFANGRYRTKMSIREAFRVLENYVDSSDPDVSLPNMIHMFQAAEGIRKAGHPDWFQLVGLIHDMGLVFVYCILYPSIVKEYKLPYCYHFDFCI